jgi:lipoprotein-anchoring transpeptidase ErfK/SrfK
MPWEGWVFQFPANGELMIRRFGLFLLMLPVAAATMAAPAAAQYYSSPPSYRGAPPNGYYDNRSPPAFWADDDEDDQSVRGRRAPQMSQNPPGQAGAPSRILPYPDEADAASPPPPGFAPPPGGPPVYGHQLEQQPPAGPPPRGANNDPDAIRPPGAIGSAPSAAPGAPGAPPQTAPAYSTASLPPEEQPEQGQPKELPANLKRQLVDFSTKEPAGTIVVDTANTYLYLVLGGGKAIRYGVRVGREGFTWTGTERISKMKEWPDWFPPPEMIERQPYLPRMMAGSATRSTAYTAPTSRRPSATMFRRAASACSTRTSRISIAACRSARVSSCFPASRRRRWPILARRKTPNRRTRWRRRRAPEPRSPRSRCRRRTNHPVAPDLPLN